MCGHTNETESRDNLSGPEECGKKHRAGRRSRSPVQIGCVVTIERVFLCIKIICLSWPVSRLFCLSAGGFLAGGTCTNH